MENVACYCRVSTTDQNLARQVTSTLGYARDQLGAEVTAEMTDQEIAEYVDADDTDDGPVDLGGVTLYYDKSTGTNTQRAGYKEMMGAVEAGSVAAVVAHSVTRVCRSIRDLERTAERIVDDHGRELHIVSEGFQITGDDTDPYQRAMFQLLGVFGELEARIRRQNTREGLAARRASDEDYHHGRPPLGFEKDDGQLIEAANYDSVVAILDEVLKGETSKRQAANELGTSRKTINRALDRLDLYGL